MIYRSKLEKIVSRLGEVETALSDPEATKDQANYQKLTREMAALRPMAEAFGKYTKAEKELEDLEVLLSDENLDSEMKSLYEEEIRSLKETTETLAEQLETDLLRESDPNSGRDVIVEIRAGTGGEEAALFASELFRMYSKFSSTHGFKVEVLASNTTGMGGLKEIVFSVTGQGVYSKFKYESGIHRVQRVPETESSGRIHTSAVTVAVMAEAEEKEVDIDPSDLRIDVFRASGAGGQHVNKTESAVRITHIPTNFVVSCQDERSQHKNKAKAMRVLRSRLYEEIQRRQQAEAAKVRKDQVGTGDRSGKIRTYNFHEQRVTDHRIGLTLHSLDAILNGHFEPLVEALERDEKEKKLADDAA